MSAWACWSLDELQKVDGLAYAAKWEVFGALWFLLGCEPRGTPRKRRRLRLVTSESE